MKFKIYKLWSENEIIPPQCYTNFLFLHCPIYYTTRASVSWSPMFGVKCLVGNYVM